MPSLMTETTFANLSAARARIVEECEASDERPAEVFVPWAGNSVIRTGTGLYFVGMALDRGGIGGNESFADALRTTESLVSELTSKNTPFWHFVNQICHGVLGSSARECLDRFGWSNLFKIADARKANPKDWRPSTRLHQLQACRAALKEELGNLSGSLVIIMSANEYEFLYKDVADKNQWDTENRQGKTFFFWDECKKNLFVHSNHPHHMQRKRYMADAAQDTVCRAKALLPKLVQPDR